MLIAQIMMTMHQMPFIPEELRSNTDAIFDLAMLALASLPVPGDTDGLSPMTIDEHSTSRRYRASDRGKACCVCTEDLGVGQSIRTLTACQHDFHKKCIDRWLSGHDTCPLCRKTIGATSSV